ncbi:MAG: DUF3574 domain-containing protein [Pleurocapsa sp. SU_196_0]|nr:DUF3574 domain-containing protein [Pleurocapsa sp. SU_196_0]
MPVLGATLGLMLIGALSAPLASGVTTSSLGVAANVPTTWNRTELFFGSAKPDGSSVAEQDFSAFVDKEVTPRFPEGLTLLTGYGQFRGSSGKIVKERSFVLILLTEQKSAKDADAKIEAIRKLYKNAFKQESVLRVDEPTRVSF